ncbi:MAG: GGDEF and EAL domain-containing protein [Lachnospiraceae bacterium]|nr:GGDEF and EAL domain-containing protein [Lachnospiraceae bacterium]
MNDLTRIKYFNDIFEIFSSKEDGHFTFWADYNEGSVYWSRDMMEYYGFPAQIVAEKGALDFYKSRIHPEDLPAYEEQVDDMFSNRSEWMHSTYRILNKDNVYVTCTTDAKLFRGSEGKPIFFAGKVINHEVSEIIDPVTGLYNRTKLLTQMTKYENAKRAYYLMIIGIRNFVSVNDTFGYRMGNKVLKEIATYARGLRLDGHVFRVEGTKFGFILKADRHSKEDLTNIYRRFQAFLENDLIVDGKKITLNICGGAVRAKEPYLEHNPILNSALYAISKAKEQNLTTLLFDEEENEQDERHLMKTLSAIRKDMIGEQRNFHLEYQPIVGANDGSTTGMEALLRWSSEEIGNVPPSEFIPWLEKDGRFYELGNWIIRQAIRDASDIVKARPDFMLNINIAYPQIQREEFVDDVVRIIEEENFPPKNIKFELTERCKLLNMEMLRNKMISLKSMDAMVALDDFGTGYSALDLLINLPVDQIKIDRSFVFDIQEDLQKQSLLRAITNCAKELGKTVCIEGIEDDDLAIYLSKNFYVSHFQGFYYSKPMVINDVINWIEKH